MAKPRNTASSSLGTGSVVASSAAAPGSKCKRVEYEDATGQSGSKKTYYMAAGKKRDRSQTPGTKNAHFAKQLTMGATPAEHISGRGGSPYPSNIRKASDSNNGPGTQLQGDLNAATLDHDNVPSLRPGSRRPSVSRKRLSDASNDGGSTGLSTAFENTRLLSPTLSPKQKKPASPKSRSRHTLEDLELDDDGIPEATLDATVVRASSSGHMADDEVCGAVNTIREEALAFAASCPTLSPKSAERKFNELLVPDNEHLIRYIGCLAMGGRLSGDVDNEVGWKHLLTTKECRSALVFGVIGRALKEHVFSELYFGAIPDLSEVLREQEQKFVGQDGFFRTQQRAMAITSHKVKAGDAAYLRKAVARITLQLEDLLWPLWEQCPGGGQKWDVERKREELGGIVWRAAELSRKLRTSQDVVYYWPPTFKDEEFEPIRMECYNLRAMISESPYDKKDFNGHERAVLRTGEEHRSEAVVQIVCFPGLVAYRRHGGELAKQELADEKTEMMERDRREKMPPDVKRHRQAISHQDKSLDENNGFRTRTISKSVVWLQWSKQRLLTREAGTSRHVDETKKNPKDNRYTRDDKNFTRELYQIYLDKQKSKRQQPPQQGNQGLIGAVTGFFAPRSSSMSAEPTPKSGVGGRKGGRTGSRGSR